ncbi:MAG TPA: DNA alkylation repair protein [Tenuifilaceae bacterium]|nr:DNA alkylation repair protein [Tenuifilaceae bacterium]HPI45215.1 DNA alkylation repair protein [Tenuifilaceae bacterium]HPN20881.1 DNA alkylation repair protein [Tenuifilaceae bacterium]
MENIISEIRNLLIAKSSEEIRLSGQRFFKEKIKSHGVKSADVIKIGKTYFKQIENLSKKDIFKLCEELWESGYIEESFIACNWSYYIHKKYEPNDFKVFEKWVSTYVNNWASCDTLCNHTVGEFVEMYPNFINELKRWAKSNNRWMKRAAAVSLIIPARKGLFLNDIFDIANILLLENDDLVQKGYGWMLKAASQSNRKAVFDYVISKKHIMPRTALRYAIEKMPKELKVKAMEK